MDTVSLSFSLSLSHSFHREYKKESQIPRAMDPSSTFEEFIYKSSIRKEEEQKHPSILTRTPPDTYSFNVSWKHNTKTNYLSFRFN